MLHCVCGATGRCGIGPEDSHASFYYKGLKAPDAILLAADLSLRTALTILDLPSNDIGPEGASVLAPSVRDHPSLTSINLSFNRLCGINHSTGKGTYSAVGVRAIADAIRASSVSSLVSLNLRYNDMREGEMVNLQDAVTDRSGSFVRRARNVLPVAHKKNRGPAAEVVLEV